jgi:DNA-directed RNA polymerase subunit beta'
MKSIEASPIEKVEVRSPLCEALKGICAKCYRNLATGKMTQRGEAVGVIAAQSIGEARNTVNITYFPR